MARRSDRFPVVQPTCLVVAFSTGELASDRLARIDGAMFARQQLPSVDTPKDSTMFCSGTPKLAFLAALFATGAMAAPRTAKACPFCSSAVAERVRSELFGPESLVHLLAVLAPAALLALMLAAAHYCTGRSRPPSVEVDTTDIAPPPNP